MITLLLISQDDAWRVRLAAAIPEASVFVATDALDAFQRLSRSNADLVIWKHDDHDSIRPVLDRIKEIAPTCVTIAIIGDPADDASSDFVLEEECTQRQVATIISQALERGRLLQEVAALKARVEGAPSRSRALDNPLPAPATLLKEFTRILAAGFDLARMLETFVEAVVELLRPARLAVLLPDTDGKTYRIHAQRGLSPQLAETIRLPADRGLCHWLAIEGRPARGGEFADLQVTRELALLQGTMAVPLLARGELVAVLVVGPPVVRNSYVTHEVETLFDLATHLAAAIQSVSLHHRLQRASAFNEQILEHMSSGVITIGADERVRIMNRRAAEILDIKAQTVIGQDLRILPSPLGDLLYETLSTGRARPRAEIRLALRGLWIEVSAYPVHGDETTGAVLVFEDLTAQKQLAAQKLQAEQFELLTRVVARIADEIKNPLVSINAFTELIGERFDDPDFRQQFSLVVGRDVRRVAQVFEKLTGLVTQGELNFSTVDIHGIVDDAVTAVAAADDATRRPIDVHVTREPGTLRVKVDAAQLRKALCYLVWYLGFRSPDRAAVAISVRRHVEESGPDDVQVVVASRTATVPARESERLFDPVKMVQENLIDIGPAVSQRIVEALGGRLTLREGRHDVAFVMTLPTAI